MLLAPHSALLLIDVQNDFCPGGSLAVPHGDQVVPALNALIRIFITENRPILASRDWHPAQTSHFQAWGGPWPPHCVAGTHGAAFHARLDLPASAVVFSKGMAPDADSYSAFEAVDAVGTELAPWLATHGITQLYIGGLATDYCVKSSVLDARRHGLDVYLLTDAVAGVELKKGDTATALAEMQSAGAQPLQTSSLAT